MKTRIILSMAVALAMVFAAGASAWAQSAGSEQAAGQQAQRMTHERQIEMGAQLYISPSDLAAVKEQLKQMGHDPGEIDGRWNSNVQQALTKFQQAQGLEPTGNLNLATLDALGISQNIGREGAGQKQDPKARNQGAPVYISPATVRELQNKLQQAGHDPGAVDGRWGPSTIKAIQAYQKEKGTAPTGHITLRLLADMGFDQHVAVLAGGESQAMAHSGATGQQTRAYLGQPQSRGEGASPQAAGKGAPLYISKEGVRHVQQALKEAGHDPGSMDGLWGPSTAKATREFQNEKEMAPTGNLNTGTLHALVGGLDFDTMAQSDQGETMKSRQETMQSPQQDQMRQPDSSPGMQSEQPMDQSADQPMGQSGQEMSPSDRMEQPPASEGAAQPSLSEQPGGAQSQ